MECAVTEGEGSSKILSSPLVALLPSRFMSILVSALPALSVVESARREDPNMTSNNGPSRQVKRSLVIVAKSLIKCDNLQYSAAPRTPGSDVDLSRSGRRRF